MDKPLFFELSKDKKTLNRITTEPVPFDAGIYNECSHCKGTLVKPVLYSYNWKNRLETVMVRCLNVDCLHHMWMTIHSLTNDGGLYANNNTQVHNEISYDKVTEDVECIKCNTPYSNRSGDVAEFHEILKSGLFASRVLECGTCGDYQNIVNFHPPFSFSQSLFKLANDTNHPHSKVVLIVSAIEIYFKKVHECINKLTEDDSKKHLSQNFQKSGEIKNFIKKELGCNVEQLARLGKSTDIKTPTWTSITVEYTGFGAETVSTIFEWNVLLKYIEIRHKIIHNAGYDESYRQISVSKEEADDFYINAKNFIRCVNTEFIKKLYPF